MLEGCVLAGLLALAAPAVSASAPAISASAPAIPASAPAIPASAPGDRLPTILPVSLRVEPRKRDDRHELPPDTAKQLRKDALARALVWLKPEPVGKVDLRHNPRDVFDGRAEVACRFHPDKTSGSTPKFECVFAGGEVLKVKYGRSPEIHTEVAATRLLRALGAGADTMYLMRRVRCFGCPKDPEAMLRCISSPLDDVRRQCAPSYGATTDAGVLQIKVDYAEYVDFDTVAIERKWGGKAIETKDKRGWGFDEIDVVEPGERKGARAERDALRLIAAFINNWDNKADNQRLVCLEDGALMADGGCHRPFAYMHDLGATFGRVGGAKKERKLDLEGWRATPVWKDAATCLVKVESPPLHGATFGEASISEAGRAYLARRLRRLRTRDVRDLFEGARFAEYAEASGPSRDVGQWVGAFEEKVRQITERAPCPTP
jgi:hypothetical protein